MRKFWYVTCGSESVRNVEVEVEVVDPRSATLTHLPPFVGGKAISLLVLQ